MSIGIFSNAVPRDFPECLGRRTSLTAGLMVDRTASASPLLLVPAGAGWEAGGRVQTWDSFGDASEAMVSSGVPTLVVDYDCGSGTPNERLGFLRVASSLVEDWRHRPGKEVVLVSGGLGTGEDGGLASFPNLSRRQVLGRIAEQARARFTFSSRLAKQLGKRLGKPFGVLPAGSAVGKAGASREAARARLGYDGDEICLIGVLGRPGTLDEDRVAAGVREVTRVFPGSRVLRLHSPGDRAQEGETTRGGVIGDAASSGWGATRLQALDLVMHPLLGGAEGDDGVIHACLQHGLPIVGTLPSEGTSAEFMDRPEGFGLVSDRDVGRLLEWLERFEVVMKAGGAERWRRELERYYGARCSATIALDHLARGR